MLQTMRHLAQSWVFKGLMMLLVVSFGIWGIGDIFRGNPMQRAVATVGDETISVQDLKQKFDVDLAVMRRSFGPELTEQQAKQLGLLDKVLEDIIMQKQMDLAAAKLGIDVTDKATLNWFASLPQFRNKDGSLNRQLLRDAIEKDHSTEAEFIKKWQDQIVVRELYDPFVLGLSTPQAITDAVTRARAQKRILDVVTLANDSMRDVPAPVEATLREYYDKNQKTFTAPEYRAVTVAVLSTADAAKDISISDDQLKKEYEARIAQYSHPERRDILQVVAQDEGKAKQLAAAARSGGNLATAATDAGLRAVPINGTEEKTILPEVAKAVFSLTLGQISDPVKSPLGWHVIQLKAIVPPGTSSFDEVKDKLRETMQHDQAIEVTTHAVNQLDDELAAGHALEDIADSLKLKVTKVAAVDATGKTPEGKDPTELPFKEDVLKTAFTQSSGDTSPVLDDRNGSYFVVRTDQVTPSAPRPFDKIKDKVVAAWKTEQQDKRAAAEAEDIAKGLREGKASSSFAARDGVEVRVSKPVTLLGDADPAIPASVLPQIAKMKKGDVITTTTPGHQMVLRLAELVNPDAAAIKLASIGVAKDLDHQMIDELMGEYRNHLRQLFPSRVNADVLEALRQQGI